MTTKPTIDEAAGKEIERIAKTHFLVKTLETGNSDRLDFHCVSAWSIKVALEAAYLAGMQAKHTRSKR